jgi:hypothetical protein
MGLNNETILEVKKEIRKLIYQPVDKASKKALHSLEFLFNSCGILHGGLTSSNRTSVTK